MLSLRLASQTQRWGVSPVQEAIVISTSTEFTVLEAVETKYFNYKAYRLKISDTKPIKQIYVLHESEHKRVQAELKEKLALHQSGMI